MQQAGQPENAGIAKLPSFRLQSAAAGAQQVVRSSGMRARSCAFVLMGRKPGMLTWEPPYPPALPRNQNHIATVTHLSSASSSL